METLLICSLVYLCNAGGIGANPVMPNKPDECNTFEQNDVVVVSGGNVKDLMTIFNRTPQCVLVTGSDIQTRKSEVK